MPSDMDAYGDGAFGAVFVDPTSEDNEACKGYAACWSIDVWSGAECPEGITLSLTVYDGPGDDADAPVLSTLTQTEAPSGGVAAGSVTHMMATTSGEGATSDTLSVTLDDVGCADL